MSLKETHRYDDIIDLPHHVSPRRPQMPRQNRAAQFMPFAALSGYENVIAEADRRNAEAVAQANAPTPLIDGA